MQPASRTVPTARLSTLRDAADGRHLVPGMAKQIALCAAHAEEWKAAGLVARRSGPRRGAA